MIRGFLTGAVLGGVVAVGGLATISVLTHNPKPKAEEPQVAPGVAETAPAAPATPSPETPVAEVQPQADTAPQSPATPDAPAAPDADTQVAALDTPAAPPATGAETTAPAAPALPEEAAPAPDTAAADPGVEAPRTAPSVPDTPAAEPAPPAAEAPPLPPLTPEEEALLKQLGDGTGDLPPEPAPEPVPEPALEPTPEPSPQPDPAPPAEEPVSEEPASTLAPAPALKSTAEGVRTNKLPRIGDAPAAETAVEDTRPLVQYAQAFDNPTQKPLYAIILVDNGAADLDRAALAALSFPVTFALDPLDPNTRDRAAIYRAAGQEVVMLATGIPDGAQASDLEVAFGVMGEGLPEAVAVLDVESGAFQKDRVLSTQVVPLIADQGRGLVTWDRGLNAADQVARREGLPAAVVFRSLDAEGETTPIIRRYLDRAAFKAAQEGRVVVVGSTRPETVAALIEWAIEGRSSTVALAPVTAVLTTN